MADLKISQLSAITTLDGTEEFVVADSGATKKITATNVGTALGGGYALIEEISVGSGGAANVDFDSIPATYRHLQLRFLAQSEASGTSHAITIQFNNDSTAANYHSERNLAQAATVAGSTFANSGFIGAATATGIAQPSHGLIDIPYYANTVHRKGALGHVGYHDGTNNNADYWYARWTGTAAINQVKFALNGGSDFKEGTIFSLYGIA